MHPFGHLTGNLLDGLFRRHSKQEKKRNPCWGPPVTWRSNLDLRALKSTLFWIETTRTRAKVGFLLAPSGHPARRRALSWYL